MQTVPPTKKPRNGSGVDTRAYNSIFEAHPQPVLIWDRATFAILDANAASVKQYGYRRDQLLSKTILDIRPPEEIPRLKRILIKRRTPLKEVRFIHRRRDGTTFDAIVNTHWLNYLGRKAALAIIRDVTIPISAARSLHESEQRLRLLVDAVRDYAIITLDPNGIVTSWNEGAHRLMGYRDKEIIGRHSSVLYTPADLGRGLAGKLLRKALGQGRVDDRGWRVRKDGSRFHAYVVISPIKDASGRHCGFAEVTRDTTEGDHATANAILSRGIVRAEEAERRRVARELHDGINQLLGAAIFRFKDAEERLPKTQPARSTIVEARKILECAIQEVRRISQNLRPIVLDTLGLKEALRGACSAFRRSAALSVRLDVSGLPESLPEEIELTVYRIVQEALNNAARHADARRVSVVVLRRANEIHLSVRDDGKGFTLGNEGSGLNNIRERAYFLGGRCEFRSLRGRGTSVQVTLPERR